MYRMTNLFSYVAAIFLTMLIFLLITGQNMVGNQRLFDRQIKAICRLVPLVFGIKVNVQSLSDLIDKRTYIFIANHVNLFDGFILYGYLSHFVRGVELEDHFKWPIWGSLVKRLGNIPISHKNTAAALESLNVAAESIKEGTSIIILPEGHRTRTGLLMPFHRGPFRLAKHTNADIIPLLMKGAWERKSVLSPFVKPGRVDLIIGEPISSVSYSSLSDKALRDLAFKTVQNLSLKAYLPEFTTYL